MSGDARGATVLAVVAALGLASVSVPVEAERASGRIPSFPSIPLRFQVGRIDGADVVTEAWLETRADRHALGALVAAKVVNCFVVESMRDVDDPTQWRRGVHWHPLGRRGRHFVVITSIAGPKVLAHELGHFFGNRRHSPTPGNIMSYESADVEPFFDDRQVAKIHRTLRRMIATRELVGAGVLAAGARVARGRSGP